MDFLNDNDPSKIVNPTIRNIGNCKFRTYDSRSAKEDKMVRLEPYLDNDVTCTEREDDVVITLTKSGKFMAKFHVAAVFYGGIIGPRGSRKHEIELNTDTQIKIPRHGETGDIIITGTRERNVAAARLRILMIVLHKREDKPVTHFVTVQMSSMEILQNFTHFKESVLNGPPLRGVDESIFQTADKLHLTITPLVLLDQVEIDLAVQVLNEFKLTLKNMFKNSGPLKIVLQGLEIMNDDPTEVDVLYGKVALNISAYNPQLQEVADSIQGLFSAKGLTKKIHDGVKLHVTLMNSLFRKRVVNDSQRQTFDASAILNKFKEFYFGEVDFKEIVLVIRFTVADDKFYEKLTRIEI